MKDAIDHRHTWQIPDANLKFMLVIEDWLGPTAGIINCDNCHLSALAYLLAWRGKQCEQRIFSVKLLPPAVIDTYLANIHRDYCDLSRKQSETQALFAATGTTGQLIEYNVNTARVTRVSMKLRQASPKSWQALTESDFERWSPLLEDSLNPG